MTSRLTVCTAIVALLSSIPVARAQDCAQVEVQNLRPDQGPLMLAAYTDAASFRKIAAVELRVRATAETMTLQVCGLGGNVVALTLFQDLNSNGKLDSNPFGIPTEPWGASGKTSAMSAPTWESAQVALDGSTIVVKLSQ